MFDCIRGMARETVRGARTRARLLGAAEFVFGNQGYHDASIVEITRVAGVGIGTFYGHFEGKRAILEELVRDRGRELQAHLRDALRGLECRREMEDAGFRAFFRWIAAHPGAYRVARDVSTNATDILGAWGSFTDAYAASLAIAMGAGEIPQGDPEMLASALIGMADSVAMRYIVRLGRDHLCESKIDEFVTIATRALGLTPA